MTNAAEAKPKMPIKKLDAVLCHLEHLQQRVMDSADNAEINHAKDTLMRLLTKWENQL